MTEIIKKFQIGFLIVLAYLILLLSDPIATLINKAIQPDLFSAQIVIKDNSVPNLKPSILYTRIAQVPLEGKWVSSIQEVRDGEFEGVCSGDGTGVYLPETSGMVRMSWDFFLGEDCDVPDVPYRICTHYKLNERAKEPKGYGQFCSATRRPPPID